MECKRTVRNDCSVLYGVVASIAIKSYVNEIKREN